VDLTLSFGNSHQANYLRIKGELSTGIFWRGYQECTGALAARFQLAPDISETEVDGALRHSKLLDRQPRVRTAVVTGLVGRIDDPDVTHAHLAIVGQTFVVAQNAVFRGKYL